MFRGMSSVIVLSESSQALEAEVHTGSKCTSCPGKTLGGLIRLTQAVIQHSRKTQNGRILPEQREVNTRVRSQVHQSSTTSVLVPRRIDRLFSDNRYSAAVIAKLIAKHHPALLLNQHTGNDF